MKVVMMFLIAGSIAKASVPQPIVTGTDSYNGFATVCGKLDAKPDHPMGISLANGNILSSTITDPDGRWSVVFRQRSIEYTVASWSLADASDRSEITGVLSVSETLHQKYIRK